MKQFIICLLMAGCAIAVSAQKIEISKKQNYLKYKPQVLNTVQVYYDPSGTKLEGEKNIEAVLYLIKSKRPVAVDLEVLRTANGWNTSFTLPDSGVAFALRFSSGDIIDDNNGAGYIFQVYEGKKPVKGSYAGKAAIFYHAQRPLALSSKNRTKALEMYENEFALHPAMKSQYEMDYLSLLISVKKKESIPVVEKKISELLNSKPFSEDSVLQAARFYSYLGMAEKADSLKKTTIEKIPHGSVARSYMWDKFQHIKAADSMLIFYQQFAKQFKDDDGDDYSYMILYISDRFVEEGRLDDALKIISTVNNKELGADIYKDVALALIKKEEKLMLADSIASVALKLYENSAFRKNNGAPSVIPASDWKRSSDEKLSQYFAACASVKAALKDTLKALVYQEKAVELTHGEKALINENYISYLVSLNETARARTSAEQYIKGGFVTSNIKNQLRKIYAGSVPYDKYVDSLEAFAREKMRKVIEKDLMDKKLDNFVLPSLNGEKVSLASLKGKVVVMDFWATWCTPCKASFPGMQNAVNKYKNDTGVVFLFIDTWETSSGEVREKMLKKFLNEHNYSFEVLLDEQLPGGGKAYKLAKDFGLEGIPSKFVVGKDGRIKFTSIGFKGDMQLLEAELSTMIEIAKKV